MDGTYAWLLTDRLGRTLADGQPQWLWGRDVTHTSGDDSPVWGYDCQSVHLPYLLDPVYDRYGSGARLWRCWARGECAVGEGRIYATEWTTLEEELRPSWAGGPADAQVRLRFCLLAMGDAYSEPGIRSQLCDVPLADLYRAALDPDRLERWCRRLGLLPQESWLLFQAIRSAICAARGQPGPDDETTFPYPAYAWHVAVLAASSGLNLDRLADDAVLIETAAPAAPVVRSTNIASSVEGVRLGGFRR